MICPQAQPWAIATNTSSTCSQGSSHMPYGSEMPVTYKGFWCLQWSKYQWQKAQAAAQCPLQIPDYRLILHLYSSQWRSKSKPGFYLLSRLPTLLSQLQRTYLITPGTAPGLSQHSSPCRHSPNSSLPCRHNGNCWGFPNTRAHPMDYSHAGTWATSSYKGTSQPSYYTAHQETS